MTWQFHVRDGLGRMQRGDCHCEVTRQRSCAGKVKVSPPAQQGLSPASRGVPSLQENAGHNYGGRG